MQATEKEIIELHDLLRKKPGKQDGFLHLVNGSSETVIYLGRDMRLELTGDLLKSADSILGAGATRFS
jgi:hypothetical protein